MPKELPLFVDVSELRILEIDPGLASIGYGIIHETTALDYGAITTPKTLTLPLRLKTIHTDILELAKCYSPEAVAIEYPFFGRDNPNQGLVLQALGVIRVALAEAGLTDHILTASIYNQVSDRQLWCRQKRYPGGCAIYL